MADIPKWDGTPTAVSGSTPFGFYDSDTQFKKEAPRLANWVARRLGYPITDVELQDKQIYACLEEAVTEYGAQVHQFNIRQNMLKAQGSSTASSLNNTPVNDGSLSTIIGIAQDYGSEAGVGGNVDYQRGFIQVNSGSQIYDLLSHPSSSLNPSSSFYDTGSNVKNIVDGESNIEIKEIFHNITPASDRYYGYGNYGSTGGHGLLGEFGFTGYGYGYEDSYILYPVYEDMLRMQIVEISDEVRRSAYTFKLRNNRLEVFPIPREEFKIWFDFIEKNDRSQLKSRDGDGIVSDYSNIPYNNLSYSGINDVGKQWIRKYTLALCKEVLGEVREKYASIPIPGDNITLNGPALRSEAQTEKEFLITQLRENLEETSRQRQMEIESNISENMQNQMSRIPLKIYVG